MLPVLHRIITFPRLRKGSPHRYRCACWHCVSTKTHSPAHTSALYFRTTSATFDISLWMLYMHACSDDSALPWTTCRPSATRAHRRSQLGGMLDGCDGRARARGRVPCHFSRTRWPCESRCSVIFQVGSGRGCERAFFSPSGIAGSRGAGKCTIASQICHSCSGHQGRRKDGGRTLMNK